MFAWPQIALRSTPPVEHAPAFAELIRRAAMGPAAATERLDDDALCRRGGLVLEEATLHAAQGRLEALLFPCAGDRFRVVVDPEPRGGWDRVAPERRAELRRHRLRFRLAHEVGHTLFYDRSAPRPRPLVGTSPTQEAFCDEFARALLIPPVYAATLAPTAISVVDLHARFDVSVELACRALSQAHRGQLDVTLAVTGVSSRPTVQWTSRVDGVGEWAAALRALRRRAVQAAGVTAIELPHRNQVVVVAS